MTPRRMKGSGSAARCFRDGAVVALVLSCGLAWAANVVPAAKFHVQQPSQAMAESLRQIARQTGASVLFDPSKVNGKTAKAVNGTLTAAEAIAEALDGSGLEAVLMEDGSIVIRAAPSTAPTPASAPRHNGAPGGGHEPVAASGDADAIAHSSISATGGVAVGVAVANDTGAMAMLDRIVVTGSRLKRIEAEGPAPVNVYSRKDIERSGQPTLERFLSSLNEASVSPGEGAFGATTGQGTVQLRGLPLGSTLVLLNGRRVQAVGSSDGDFFNLNLIPMAAIERIEIVPVGSSAVYGGDALAGVVNIILKKSMEGVALDAQLSGAKGTHGNGISLATGGQGDAGSFIVLGAYSRTTPLMMSERAFFADADYRRLGGVDARSRNCSPGTVTSTNGANLPGLTSNLAGIPANPDGKMLTAADFAASAGRANLCNSLASGNGTALVQAAEDFSLHASGERRLSADWSVFAETSFTKNRQGAQQSGLLLSNVLVPASNPYNPFGTAVRVTERLGPANGADSLYRETNFKRLLAGIRGNLGASWDFEASASMTRDDGARHLANVSANVPARTAALAATSPSAALNPFTSGAAASEAVLQSIWSDQLRENHGRRDQVSAFVRGSPFQLPAGSVDVIAGAEAARDHYQTLLPGDAITTARSSHAFYGEAHVPLLRSGERPGGEGTPATPAHELAALTLAARHDGYTDFGGATTYQAGLEFRPLKTFLLRGSLATSFKPPTLPETHLNPDTYDAAILGLVDPARGGEPLTSGQVLVTNNPDLHPEKGRAKSLGFVWEPATAAGTRLGMTAWQVRIDGLISLPWLQVTLDHEALFPGIITRGPSVGGVPGPVTKMLWTFVNYGRISTAGVDLEAAHSWQTSLGKWTLAASATRTNRYDVALTPDAPLEDRLGRRALDYWSPRWKGRIGLSVDRGDWNLGLTSRYLGAYQDLAPSTRGLGNYWRHDLAASFDLKRLGLRLPAAKQASLSVAIANITNRLPAYASGSPYYDVTQADWRGRYANLRLSVSW
ncbi:TonB-dependent receptor domain-containing protein [Burkholderiaceae bacterium UC74_6]